MGLGRFAGGAGLLVSSFTTGYNIQSYRIHQQNIEDISNKPEMVQLKKFDDELNYTAVRADPFYDSDEILSETDEIELYFLEEEFNRISKERKEFRGDKKIAGLETTIRANERKMKKDKIDIFLSAACIVCFGGMVYSSRGKGDDTEK